MSEHLEIRPDETDLVWLFSIDTAAAPLMSSEPDWDIDPVDPPWPLRDALGTLYLDSDFIELFDVADLGDRGLAGYMVTGFGISPDQLAEDRARLDTLRGLILVVTSSALGGFAQTLTPKPPLRWIGTYRDTRQAPQVFRADRATYWREHAWIAAIAMAFGMGALWAIGNPHVWTGAVGGLFAVAVRAFYLASDEATAEWRMTATDIFGPENRQIPLAEIDRLRTFGSAVQIITRAGDKHLMKYMADRPRVAAEIEAAMARAGNAP